MPITSQTTPTDQNSADAAIQAERLLAVGMQGGIPDFSFESYDVCLEWSRLAIQAITANPAILAPWGIGRLPTESTFRTYLPYGPEEIVADMIRDGYLLADSAVEDKQEDDVSTQIDTDSAADLDAVHELSEIIYRTEEAVDAARAVLAYLRNHPEHGPWPVMMASEAATNWINSGCGTTALWLETIVGTLIIPDPPAQEEPLPTVDDVRRTLNLFEADIASGRTPVRWRSALMDAYTRLADAAAKGTT